MAFPQTACNARQCIQNEMGGWEMAFTFVEPSEFGFYFVVFFKFRMKKIYTPGLFTSSFEHYSSLQVETRGRGCKFTAFPELIKVLKFLAPCQHIFCVGWRVLIVRCFLFLFFSFYRIMICTVILILKYPLIINHPCFLPRRNIKSKGIWLPTAGWLWTQLITGLMLHKAAGWRRFQVWNLSWKQSASFKEEEAGSTARI